MDPNVRFKNFINTYDIVFSLKVDWFDEIVEWKTLRKLNPYLYEGCIQVQMKECSTLNLKWTKMKN